MTYAVQADCVACDQCRPTCPQGAIKPSEKGYWIDPTLCNQCPEAETPPCVEACDLGALAPLQPKKGRHRSTLLPVTIPSIFLNGKTTPFASSMVVWETCNLLAQRQALPWHADDDQRLCYLRSIHRGRGTLRLRLATNPEDAQPSPLSYTEGLATLAQMDLRAACLHLIFAAHATTLDQPWNSPFTINDQHIETYLGLNRRKDLSKLEKLTLIKTLVYQACQPLVSLDWPRQGRVRAFSLPEHPVWQRLDTQYYFEPDAEGNRHLIGLSFTLQAGIWSRHFLNRQDYRKQTAFYQYGTLPQSLLTEVMSRWQQHEGAMRLLLWLVFKLRLGQDQRMTVRTLLRIAYGEDRLTTAMTVRGAHKRLLRTFETDLETLHHYGLSPQFDPETYGPDIQPLWARVADIPDDADDALDFWADDAHQDLSLTQRAPRDKWPRLLNARILGFDLAPGWQQPSFKPHRRRRPKASPQTEPTLSTTAIRQARQQLKISQRDLAQRMGKSQSWVRDVEKGRFQISPDDQRRLRTALEIL